VDPGVVRDKYILDQIERKRVDVAGALTVVDLHIDLDGLPIVADVAYVAE